MAADLYNLVSQNLLIKVDTKIVTHEVIYLKGALKIHMPLDSMVAYVQEGTEIVKTFASIQSLSLQYNVIRRLHDTRQSQSQSQPQPQTVVYEGTSVPRSSTVAHTSLIRTSEPIFTDLLSNDPLPAFADTHQELQRCMHYEFDLTCPLPLPPGPTQPPSSPTVSSPSPSSTPPSTTPDFDLELELTPIAFCLRDDIPPPSPSYLYFGPPISIPLLPEIASGPGSIFAIAKSAYLIPLELETLQRRVKEYKELEMILASTGEGEGADVSIDGEEGWDIDVKNLPKRLRLELCL